MMYGLSHLALEFVDVSNVAEGGAHAFTMAMWIALYCFGVVEKGLVDLTEMLTDVSLHF